MVLKRYFVYLTVVISIVVLFRPGGDGPLPFPQADKVIHATTFALLALGASWRLRLSARTVLAVAAVLLAYAVASEIIQHFWIPGREFDLLDIAADSLGALLVLGLVGKQAKSRGKT
jgi:VanZ family protein